jgi:hypothetical protein
MANPNQEEIERLRSVHPDYKDASPNWLFFLRSYEGGKDYVSEETLFTHFRENSADFKDRLKRAHYQNYCQPLTDFVPDFIYASEIERDPGSLKPRFDNFIKNVNRSGTSLTEFMREVVEDARMYGHVFVQVDKPSLPPSLQVLGKVTVSVAQARRLKLDPYFIKVTPLEVLDWVTDGDGKYVYLKRQEIVDVLEGRTRRRYERYTEWYTDSYTITKIDITDGDSLDKAKLVAPATFPNTLGEIPFVKVVYKGSKSNKDLSSSFLADIAPQNRSVFNLTSLIDEFLYRQCFNVMAMPQNTSITTKDTVEGQIGTSNVIEFPDQASHQPFYLSPPVQPAEFIQREREAIVQEMYRTAAQDIASELFSVSNRSGDAARQAFGRQVPVIARQADSLQQAEHQMFRLWAALQGDTWAGKIAYKDDYSVTSMMDLILQFSSIFTTAKVLSPTFIREEWKRLVREYDGKLTPEQLEKIVREIDAASDDDILDLIKGQSDVKAAAGVPSTANMTQGRNQQGQSDKKRSLRTGDRSHTKEAQRDANKQAKGSRAA